MSTSQERRAARVERMARFYQHWISPGLHALGGSLLPMPSGCRFQPTCSEYAAIAVSRYGWFRGTGMALARISRCHPFSRKGRHGGFDPVP